MGGLLKVEQFNHIQHEPNMQKQTTQIQISARCTGRGLSAAEVQTNTARMHEELVRTAGVNPVGTDADG